MSKCLHNIWGRSLNELRLRRVKRWRPTKPRLDARPRNSQREREGRRGRKKKEKAGIVRGPAERKWEPAEKATRTMKASCSSSYMKSDRSRTWIAISMSTPTPSASSAARSRAWLHKKRAWKDWQHLPHTLSINFKTYVLYFIASS